MSGGVLKKTGWVLKAILQAELLRNLKIDKYFIHIIFLFLAVFSVILIEMGVEKTLSQVEKNKIELTNLKIYHAQQTVELVKFGRIGTIEKTLEELGSDVSFPDKPADKIIK